MVQDFCKSYIKFFRKWEKYRDAVGGESYIKEKGKAYLPMASGMDGEDYEAYKKRAQFFNACGRTLDGLVGMINRKPVVVTVPKGFDKYLFNVDGFGNSFTMFCNNCVKEKILLNWGGVLIDMPKSNGVVSQREFEQADLSAYMTLYKAESIINWNWATDGRRQYLKYVIFREEVEFEVADYAVDVKYNYRVCEINKDGYYQQTLYDDKANIISQIIPSGKKGKFRDIPFFFLSNEKIPEESILDDLININLSHYRKSADYENGLHWTGVPTPWTQGANVATVIVNGKEVAEEPLKLGGSIVQNLPSGASMHYLEFSGSGCSQIAAAMKDDEERMAILGARIISSERKGVESAETARIHRAGENSVLADIATVLSEIFSKLLWFYLTWSSGLDIKRSEVSVSFNTDYDVSFMSPTELTALVALWQNGGIAKSDLFLNLKEGEIIKADRDLDEMNAEIEEEQKAKTAFFQVTEEEY